MSKHATQEGGDFWKKVGFAATAAGAIGTGCYAFATVVNRPGFVANFIDEAIVDLVAGLIGLWVRGLLLDRLAVRRLLRYHVEARSARRCACTDRNCK